MVMVLRRTVRACDIYLSRSSESPVLDQPHGRSFRSRFHNVILRLVQMEDGLHVRSSLILEQAIAYKQTSSALQPDAGYAVIYPLVPMPALIRRDPNASHGSAVRGYNSPKGAGATGTQEFLNPARQVRRTSRHLSQKLHQPVHNKPLLQETRIQCPFTNNFLNNRSDSWSPFSVKATDLALPTGFEMKPFS